MLPETGGSNLQELLLGFGGIGAVAWAIYERLQRLKVDNAMGDSNVSMATANEALFNMLTQRLTALEAEVERMKKELDREREYNRSLVATMVSAGIVPPAYPPTV